VWKSAELAEILEFNFMQEAMQPAEAWGFPALSSHEGSSLVFIFIFKIAFVAAIEVIHLS
jgi:hypothetical protein